MISSFVQILTFLISSDLKKIKILNFNLAQSSFCKKKKKNEACMYCTTLIFVVLALSFYHINNSCHVFLGYPKE